MDPRRGTEQEDRRSRAVYVWALDLEPSGDGGRPFALRLHTRDMGREPRIFKLPYSPRLHEQTGEIQQEISAGGRFFGYLGAAGPGEGAPGGRGGKGRKGAAGPPGAGGSSPTRQDYIFHELPPPRLPEKIPPQ